MFFNLLLIQSVFFFGKSAELYNDLQKVKGKAITMKAVFPPDYVIFVSMKEENIIDCCFLFIFFTW
jgi:hypothetical protein